jgi:DNA-binding LytR/AlgR family response regulator
MAEVRVYQTLIIEDEYPARMLMIDYIMNCPELQLAGIAEDGNKAVELLHEKDFDLVFVDINLPGFSGMDVIRRVDKENAFFILTTAYSEYAVEAFDLDALDYLLKPFSYERFRKAVEKAIKFLKEKEQPKSTNNSSTQLTFVSESTTYILPFSNIHYLSSNHKSSIIHTEQKDYETSKLLKELEEKLPQNQFLRIHKSFLVNVDWISSLRYDKGGAYIIQLKNEDETVLPVGRVYANALKEKLGLR